MPQFAAWTVIQSGQTMPGKVVRATGYVVLILCSQVASTKGINLCPRISLPDDLHKAILLHPRHTVFHSSFCSSVFICISPLFGRHCEFCSIGERNTEVYTLCACVGCSSTNKYSATNSRNEFLPIWRPY